MLNMVCSYFLHDFKFALWLKKKRKLLGLRYEIHDNIMTSLNCPTAGCYAVLLKQKKKKKT